MNGIKFIGCTLILTHIYWNSALAEVPDPTSWSDEVYGPSLEDHMNPEDQKNLEPFEYRFPEEKTNSPTDQSNSMSSRDLKNGALPFSHTSYGIEGGLFNQVPFQYRHLSYGESNTGDAPQYKTESGSRFSDKNLGIFGEYGFDEGLRLRANYRYVQMVAKTSFNEGAGSFYGQVDDESQARLHRLGGVFCWLFPFNGAWKAVSEVGLELDWSQVTQRETEISFADGNRRSHKILDSQLLTLSPVFGARIAYEFQAWRLTAGPEVVLPILELQKKSTGNLSPSITSRQFRHEGAIGWEFAVSAAYAL